ncbi:3'-5' exonuclease [Amycolatopsis sp. lyj-108]|uniref:3'-5' exonuclease n=1 Tax=Amycolatopsis sp. lyj-108 TaxID=2789286 RepID=UPI003978D707
MSDVPIYHRSEVPEHLMTSRQLTAAGRGAGSPGRPDAYMLVELFDSRLRSEGFVEEFDRRAVDRHRAAVWAQEVLEDPTSVLLDTETTDLHGRVLEIAVVSCGGEVLLETLVNPEGEQISPFAAAKHGITAEMVTEPLVPIFAAVHDELVELLAGKRIVCWNADFDRRVLTAEADRLLPSYSTAVSTDWVSAQWEDAMARHAEWSGERTAEGNGYGTHRLDGGHRALSDCAAMLTRLREMAVNPELPPPPKKRGEWTADEQAELEMMARAGLSATEIAERTGRTETSVRWRLYKVDLGDFPSDLVTPHTTPKAEPAYTMDELRTVHRNSHKRWTDEEEQRLARRHAEGASIQQLVEEFGRNEGGVTARLARLSLITPPEPSSSSTTPPF